ncbi:MAG: c-type cytochrome [Acidimicrobiia bacterium]
MSDQLSAAAAAMGIPEAIAERSARARAEATGQTYEDVLAAWAGGQAVAAAPAAEAAPGAPAETTAEPASESTGEEAPGATAPPAPAAPAPAVSPAAAAATVAAPTGLPPILDAPAESPMRWVGGGIGVLVLTLLLGFVFPSLPEPSNEVRTSHFALSEAGEDGKIVYLRAGCASCHTQVVRSVVADVGIGPVALPDTNQVLGYRRIGPDLSNAGGRLGVDQLTGAITGPSHPAMALSDSALGALVAYLGETASPISGGES